MRSEEGQGAPEETLPPLLLSQNSLDRDSRANIRHDRKIARQQNHLRDFRPSLLDCRLYKATYAAHRNPGSHRHTLRTTHLPILNDNERTYRNYETMPSLSPSPFSNLEGDIELPYVDDRKRYAPREIKSR